MTAQFSLPCPCGATIAVTAGQAGASASCRCGATLPVPRLAELRRLAGQDPYATNPAERIAKLERAGQLILPDACAACYLRTDDILVCRVICERPYVEDRGESSVADRFLGLFLPFGGLLRLFSAGTAAEDGPSVVVHGRSIEALVRVRICSACRPSTAMLVTRGTLVGWLRQVPLYAELLDLYPEAEIAPQL